MSNPRIANIVRLEVQADPPAGVLQNLLLNTTGEKGGESWFVDQAGDQVHTAPGVAPVTLRFHKGTGALPGRYLSDFVPVTVGWWMGASWLPVNIRGLYRARVLFYNASGAQVAAGNLTGFLGASAARASIAPTAVPQGAAYARLDLLHYNDAGGTPNYGTYCLMRDMTLVCQPSQAVATNPPYTAGWWWTDVTGRASSITVDRAALDVGTLTATLLDTQLDPASFPTLRPGRRCRLRAAIEVDANGVGTVYDDVFNGILDRPDTSYDPFLLARGSRKSVAVTITATDGNQRLATAKRLRGTWSVTNLPGVLAGGRVPWSVNGWAGTSTLEDFVSYEGSNDTSYLEHVIRTRNYWTGFGGVWVGAWVDRYGVLQVWYSNRLADTYRGGLRDPNFGSSAGEWFGGVNCVVTWLNNDATYGYGIRATATAAGNVVWASDLGPIKAGYEYAVSWTITPTVAGRRFVTGINWINAAGQAFASTTLADRATYATNAALGYLDMRVTAPAGAVGAVLVHTGYGFAANERVVQNLGRFERAVDLDANAANLYDFEIGYGDEDNCNIITLDSLTGLGDAAEQVNLGPYGAPVSIDANGPRDATILTCYLSGSTTSSNGTYAAAILNRNSASEQRMAWSEFKVQTLEDVRRIGLIDLYDRVRHTYPIADFGHVIRLKHEIRATAKGGTWRTTITPRALERLIL